MRYFTFALVFFLAGTAPALAAPVNTLKTKAVYNSAYCSGYAQLCNAPNLVKLRVTKKQRVTLKFTASETGCSSVRVRPSINGRALRWSAFLGYVGSGTSLNSRTYNLGVLPPGDFLISTVAQGTYGGCNVGYLGSWGGTFTFAGTQTTANPTRSSAIVPAFTGLAKVRL